MVRPVRDSAEVTRSRNEYRLSVIRQGPVGTHTFICVMDFSLTFPKEVRDSAEVTRSRRGYERWRLPTKEGGGAPAINLKN